MIDGCGHAPITNFGLARLANGAVGAGEIAGTAPEQLARGGLLARCGLTGDA